MTQKVTNYSVREKIIYYLKDEIDKNHIKPGDYLPPERNLAKTLSVSRTSVKEAYASLQSMGLITIKQGSGTRLLEDNEENILLKMNIAINKTDFSILSLLEVRQSIEREAAGLAAIRRTEKDINNIYNSLVNLEQAILYNEIAAKEDLEFHLSIAKATRNFLFIEVMYVFSDRLLTSLNESRKQTQKIPGKSKEIFEDHVFIYEAIKKGSKYEAKKAMDFHLNNIKKRYL